MMAWSWSPRPSASPTPSAPSPPKPAARASSCPASAARRASPGSIGRCGAAAAVARPSPSWSASARGPRCSPTWSTAWSRPTASAARPPTRPGPACGPRSAQAPTPPRHDRGAPVPQPAEGAPLKGVKCGFEPHRGHVTPRIHLHQKTRAAAAPILGRVSDAGPWLGLTCSGVGMAVDLIGPIEVRHGDGVLRIAGARQQALVAMLALAAPHPVGDERLMDELWGDERPGNPTNALQALVSQLRRQLGREAVQRVSQGYLLVVDPGEVDANRLDLCGRAGRAALEGGDLIAASVHFREAIALVRGPPLAELLDHPFARDAATRLEQLVVDAHEGLID